MKTLSELTIEIQNLELRLGRLRIERQQIRTAMGDNPTARQEPTLTLPHFDALIPR